MAFYPDPVGVKPRSLFIHFRPEVGVCFAFPADVEGVYDEAGVAVNVYCDIL